jgi:hypothetical protein
VEQKELIDLVLILFLKPRVFDDDAGLLCKKGEEIYFVVGKSKDTTGAISFKHSDDIALDPERSTDSRDAFPEQIHFQVDRRTSRIVPTVCDIDRLSCIGYQRFRAGIIEMQGPRGRPLRLFSVETGERHVFGLQDTLLAINDENRGTGKSEYLLGFVYNGAKDLIDGNRSNQKLVDSQDRG